MKPELIKSILLPLAAAALTGCGSTVKEADTSLSSEVRPPAAPLVTVDPYFSVWSATDRINASSTRHWTGRDQSIVGAVRVDGVTYRVLGLESPRLVPVLPTIAVEPWEAKYMTDRKPSGDWTSPGYDDSSWKSAPGAFGSKDMPGVRTIWRGNDKDIYVRRTVELTEDLSASDIVLEYSHDDVFELYINGVKVVGTGYEWKNNVRMDLPAEVLKTLKPGKLTVAAHCHNTVGGSYVDFGLFKKEKGGTFADVAEQKSLDVLPTRTVATFACGGVEVDMVFTAPFFMDNLELLSRPVNYLTYQVRSVDGKDHDVQVYVEATPQLAVNDISQAVVSRTGAADGIDFVKTGTVEQNILGRKGDNVRIDWGYFYLGTPSGKGNVSLGDYHDMKDSFISTGALLPSEQEIETSSMLKAPVALAYANDLGKVGAKTVSDYILLAYDDIYSIQYFGDNLRPYWNRNGDKTITGQMRAAANEYNSLMAECSSFDRDLMTKTAAAGGQKYAELCALAYRQAIAAHKLVESPQGDLLFFSKENFSNGSIGTVDITYPSAPMFLYFNPELVKGLMNHIFYYSESGKWTKPFAAHDVGTYPLANGQTYGGDMPVEESGNMLVLTATIAAAEGNAGYAEKHWDVLTTWANYLVENGLDPANQLCTDDFAGHFAHNANLSIKAIMGIASYGKLAGMLGKKDVEEKYVSTARDMAAKWKVMAYDNDHYRLTFDKPGTWSQKYNLVWDKILGFGIFDPEIAETEIAYYLTKQNTYGLPLDSRKAYTKTDWIMWTATLADDKETFEAFIAPVWKYMDETPVRVPMSDWVYTDTPRQAGFQARSVVGGYYIKMLEGMYTR